ncbi:methyltransferase [Pseudoscourfieldia marina]
MALLSIVVYLLTLYPCAAWLQSTSSGPKAIEYSPVAQRPNNLIRASLISSAGNGRQEHSSILDKGSYATRSARDDRERVYAAYHEARRERCDGCRYIPFYRHMYPGVGKVFDGGAANCGVMRELKRRGYEVHGIEYSAYVVERFCPEFLKTGAVETGPLHSTTARRDYYDLVLCTDVLEHIPLPEIDPTLQALARITKPGGKLFLVIASDPSKHENHPERSNAADQLKESGVKIHETVMPRFWWLAQLAKYGLFEDKAAMKKFLKTNEDEVHDPRYGFTLKNFKERGYSKVYPPNQRHVARVYCLEKSLEKRW